MDFAFVSLFPDSLAPHFQASILGRAISEGKASVSFANPRDFCYDRHRKVDDAPYDGEPGMLLKAEPVALAIESLSLPEGAAIIAPDPAAPLFKQSDAVALAALPAVAFVCGHYEGIDERVLSRFCTHRFSIGDFILTGGELPALVMADAISRYIPGVLGNEGSLEADSFSSGLLSAPNYTKPAEWRGTPVPTCLRSGDHAAIAKWRRRHALLATIAHRPDLFSTARLSKSDLFDLDPEP